MWEFAGGQAPAGTLEGRFADRIAEFRREGQRAGAELRQRGAAPEEVAAAEALAREREIEYLLDAVPFIREHSTTAAVGDRVAQRGQLAPFVRVTHTSNKNNVLQRYLLHVEGQADQTTLRAQHDHDAATGAEAVYACARCDGRTLFHARESMMVCPACGECRTHSEMNAANMTYDEEVNREKVSHFSYKRHNHFCEWLNSLQAKENTEIPQHVIDAVKAEFKKMRATTRAEINRTRVRAFLKKLKLNKYYEHVDSICSRLNGVPPPKLSPELEGKLKAMFAEIQEPFERHCPRTRKNFLSYGFVLYKFCELLGEDALCAYFPLLKNNEKLHAQDTIWKKMCKDLAWEIIPTI